jgi:hypothetical protein
LKVRVIVNRGGGSFSEAAAGELHGLFAGHGVDADVRLVPPDRLHDAFAEAAGAEGLDSCAAEALAGG